MAVSSKFPSFNVTTGPLMPTGLDLQTLANEAEELLPEAPTDGKLYGRENAAWTAVPASTGGVTEAPTDGQTYGRRGSDGTWQVVPAMNGDAYLNGVNANTIGVNDFINTPQINPGGNALVIGGQPTLANDPTDPLGIASKQYADAHIATLEARIATLEATVAALQSS